MYMGAEASAPTVEAARSGRPAVSGACLARPRASWEPGRPPLPRAGRRASPWRVFKGAATYQRTPISPMSGGPCAPWTVPARRLLPR